MPKSRAEKREEALERQEFCDGLTLLQRITRAKGREGNSKRELVRLAKRLVKVTQNA